MKSIIILTGLFFCCQGAFSQVGINTVTPNAQLDVVSGNQAAPSNTDGLLIPRINNFPVTNPTAAQNGMMVFLTTAVGLKTPGFYYWDNAGTSWIGIGSQANWGLYGNAATNPATNFIGTTDDKDLAFRRNNLRAGKIEFGNTSFGVNAFNPANTGTSNSAIGDNALSANTTGSYNAAFGSSALNANTIGTRNTAIGVNALLSNLSGNYNTASGVNALRLNATGDYNTANGSYSMFTNASGLQNTAVGSYSLHDNTIGNYNTALGMSALQSNIDGENNSATGGAALFSNTGGDYNVATGTNGLFGNTTGNYNCVLGVYGLYHNVSGTNNVAVGAYTLANSNYTGDENTGVGGAALYNVSGADNTGLGYHSGFNITTGNNNLTLGMNAIVPNPAGNDQFSVANTIYGVSSGSVNTKVGINETNPNAKLQVTSSNQAAPANTDGIIIPKIDAFPATNPAASQNGMMVFLTTAIGTKPSGFYYWDNPTTSWIGVAAKNNWGLYGNSGTSSAVNYIGTADVQPLTIKTNNVERMVVGSTGNIALGAFVAAYPMEFPQSLGDKLCLYNPGVGTPHYGFGISNSLLQIHSSFSGSDIAFGYGSSAAFTENMRIRGSGYVGIGIANPQSKLHVYSGASGMLPNGNAGITIENAGNAYLHILSGTETGVLFGVNGVSTNGGIVYNSGIFTNGMAFRTNTNTTQMAISSAGNVTIGNAVANARLQVLSSNQAVPANTDGILIPKVDIFPATNPTSAQNGMMVYLNTAVGAQLAGFYYWDNTAVSWVAVGTKANWSLAGNSGTSPATNYIGTIDNADVSFRTNGSEVMRVAATGKVGIGQSIPTAELEVNGYTKLGTPAPAVKMLKLTGITAGTQGTQTPIAHGVTSSKILGVTVLVDYAAGSSVPPSYNGSAGYEYDYFVTTTSIVIWPKSGNSANILSKPIRVLLTYEQ